MDPSWIKTDPSRTLKSGLSLKEYHNAYSYLWAKGLFDRYKEAHNKRFFLFCTALDRCAALPLGRLFRPGSPDSLIANSGWTGMAYTPELQDWSGAKSYTALQAIAFTPYMVQNEWIYGKLPWGQTRTPTMSSSGTSSSITGSFPIPIPKCGSSTIPASGRSVRCRLSFRMMNRLILFPISIVTARI